jgi:hypothetical protein
LNAQPLLLVSPSSNFVVIAALPNKKSCGYNDKASKLIIKKKMQKAIRGDAKSNRDGKRISQGILT